VQEALIYLNKIDSDKIRKDIFISGLELQADIQLDYYKDTDLAVHLYSRALNKDRNIQTADRIRLKLAKAYLEKNDLKTAREEYKQISSKTYSRIAAFRLAELDFYSGQFTKAQKSFDILIHRTAPEDTVVNNALEQLLLMENFKSDSVNLSKFAKGLLLTRQKYYSRAAKQFKDISEVKNNLSIEAGMRSADLYIQLRKDEEAENILTGLLQQYPKNEKTDQALYLLAGILEKRNQPQDALKLYSRLLVEFPLSFYQDNAREKARTLSAQIEENNGL
jgi:tetratricopeptide (TPR) repeat protein